MPGVHERILETGKNYFLLSRDAFTQRDFRSAAEFSASTLGIFSFLLEDPETPDEIRSYIFKVIDVVRSRISDAHSKWIRKKVESRMSGTEVDGTLSVEQLEMEMRAAARAAIEEVEK